MILLNPKSQVRRCADERSREIVRKTIEFFEAKGKAKLRKDDLERTWYADFLEFVEAGAGLRHLPDALRARRAKERAGTPRGTARSTRCSGSTGCRYWYTWQVSILGLGPIWMSGNEAVEAADRRLLAEGGIFGFGLSEKEHGADIYSTDMELVPAGDGTYLARGDKYYIGNGNEAAILSVFGKIAGTGEYVFFAVDPKRPGYELVKNVVASQSYVAEFVLHDYPVGRGRHPPPRPGRLGRGAQHRQRRQVQPGLGLDRHLHARLLRGGPPRRQPAPLRDGGHRLPARAADVHRRLRAPRRDEALRAARRPTTSARPRARTAATSSSTRS